MAVGTFNVDVGFGIEDKVYWLQGNGSPEGSVVAPAGSFYSDLTGGDMWQKESGTGNTGWAKSLTSTGASAEDGYQNTFMGKSGVGSELPTYTGGQASGISNENLEQAIDTIDQEIGVAIATPQSRTTGAISDQAVNLNIEALDDAVGADVTPVTRTNNNPTVIANSSNANIDALDAAIGDDISANSRTNNPIVITNDIGANLEALDDAIGSDADITNTNYITVNSTVMKKLSDLDGAVKTAFNGIQGKESAKVATTAALTGTGLAYSSNQITWTATNGPTTLDSIGLTNGDRILVKNETDGAGTLNAEHNGIYVRTSQDQWDRAEDADTWAEHVSAHIWVEEGTVNADTAWICTADDGGTLGTTDIFFVLYASATSLIAGAGLDKTGDEIFIGDINRGIQVNTNDIEIDASESAGNGIKENATNSWQFDVDLATNSGLNFSSAQLILDLDDLAAGTINVAADSFAFIDADDGATYKESIADLVAGVTGNGLNDTSGVIAVQAGDSGAANLADIISVESQGISVKVDESSVQENGSGQLEVIGYQTASATGVTAGTITADQVPVASYRTAQWNVTVVSVASPTNAESVIVYALNDGATGTPDKSVFAKNQQGPGVSGASFNVDVSGGNMRLRITTTENFDWYVTRIAH